MERFIDMHCHMLPGIDDGAKDETTAFSMLDMAYRDGIRSVCFTPHCNPYEKIPDTEAIQTVYRRFSAAAKERYPDMRFSLGSEIMYYDGCTEDVRDGKCFSLCGGKYLLLEFPPDIEYTEMKRSIGRINSYGYRVLLAHAERYACLLRKRERVFELSEEDVLIQLNASLFRKHGIWKAFREKRFIRTILSSRIPFMVCTDAHNTDTRAPILSDAYRFLCGKLGQEAAHQIFSDIPESLLPNDAAD